MKSKIFNSAVEIAKKAGEKLLEMSGEGHELFWGEGTFQGYHKVKSEADKISEEIILSSIKRSFPDHSILSEESGLYIPNNSSEYTWIVDPLHDTIAYVRGNSPEFSVTIAVAKGDEIICSVLYQPAINKLYSAIKDGGSFLNRDKISVSKVDVLEQSNLSIQHNAFKYGDYQKLIPIIKKVRRMYSLGSAMFPELSSGKVDVVISYKQALYDYAATKLLVEEAGGVVTQENGDAIPMKFDNDRRFNIVASNGFLHKEILKKLE